MDNKVEQKNFFQQYMVPIFISLLISFCFNALVEYLEFEDGSITVSKGAEQEDSYISVISVCNFDNTALESISLYFKDGCKIVSVLDNPYVSQDGNYLYISEIPPQENYSFVVTTNQEILPDTVVCDSDYKIIVNFQGEERLKIITILLQTLPSVVVYSCYLILDRKHREKTLLEIKNENDKYKKTFEELTEKTEKTGTQIIELYDRLNRQKIFYQTRIQDIKKELNFWRDTIRKMMYDSTKEKQDTDKIIDLVTSNLKTYTTRENSDQEFNEILFVAELIAKQEKRNNLD